MNKNKLNISEVAQLRFKLNISPTLSNVFGTKADSRLPDEVIVRKNV